MLEQIRRFLAAPRFADDEGKTRNAALLNTILVAVFAAGIGGGLFIAALNPARMLFFSSVGGLVAALSLALWFVMRSGYVKLTGVLLSLMLWGAVTSLMCTGGGGLRATVGAGYFLCIAVAGLLLGARAVTIFTALSALSTGVIFYAETSGWIPVSLSALAHATDLITLLMILGLMALLLHFAVQNTARMFARARHDEQELSARNRELREIRASLEQRVARRTRNLEAVAQVAQTITTVLDPDELERRIVDLVRESFDLYYAGLFLIDETGAWSGEPNRWIVLRAGTGEAGQKMIAQGHRFVLGDSNSMIGRCIGEKRAIVALDVGQEAQRFDNPLLPDTHSEMALPLVSRGQVLGAMTIQSERIAAFSETEIATMQTMADQIAGAVSNARLFAAAQDALARSEEIVRRYVRESWESYVSADSVSGYLYAPGQAGPNSRAWLPLMGDALRRRDLVTGQESAAGGTELAVPLFFGDQVIGAIGLRRGSDLAWSQEEIDLVRDVSLQVAQAVETRRLFEETQRSARHEAVLRQTTDKVRSQANLDALLQVAAQEIQRAVGATHVAIRLGTEDTFKPVAPDRPLAGKGGQDG